MILHASVAADRPRKTAEVLARLMGGIAVPLGPGEGTWSAIGSDPIGNMISVLERGFEFHRTDHHVDTRRGAPIRHSAFHLLIDTSLTEAEVLNLAVETGCAALRAKHGTFDVIEYWIDDCLLIEVVTPEMGRDYREQVQSEELRQRLRPTVAAALARGQKMRDGRALDYEAVEQRQFSSDCWSNRCLPSEVFPWRGKLFRPVCRCAAATE